MPSAEQRFRAKVEVGDDHDRWTGARDQLGVGMVRIDGRLRTVQRAAWEFAHGPLSGGARVNACAGERACVRVEHLSVSPGPVGAAPLPPRRRRRRGTGSVREMGPGLWRVVVTDPTLGTRSGRRSVTVRGSRGEATAALERLASAMARDDVGDLRVRELVGRYLDWHGDETGSPDWQLLHEVLEPAMGAQLVALLSPAEVEDGLRDAVRGGLDRRVAADALRLLRRALGWASDRGWCREHPAAAVTMRDVL